jgi:DNA-binding NtrC family response regulator
MSFSEPDPAVAQHVLREVGQGFLGESRAAAAVRGQIADFLARHRTDIPPPAILLRGEDGVGKSLLARLIHRAGPRRDKAFVTVSCDTTPLGLLDSLLFGYEKGAFTRAESRKAGLLHIAHGGTLFFDGVEALPVELQAMMVMVLAQRAVRPIGSARAEPADMRVIAATSSDLSAAVRQHRFREDLYEYLRQLDVLIPPLRQRPDDILVLAEHFLAHVCAETYLPPKSFAPDAQRALLAYGWPGNARDVQHLMERVVSNATDKDTITAAMLALPI